MCTKLLPEKRLNIKVGISECLNKLFQFPFSAWNLALDVRAAPVGGNEGEDSVEAVYSRAVKKHLYVILYFFGKNKNKNFKLLSCLLELIILHRGMSLAPLFGKISL